MAAAITTTEVQRASAELARMRRSLRGWLQYRTRNDRVMAGTARTRMPLAYAQRVIAQGRDLATEQDLATKIAALLSQVMPGTTLPVSDLSLNPRGAVELAQIALRDGAAVSSPPSTGSLLGAGGIPWWPVIIVGGLLLTVTTAIRSAADVAKDREEKACIQAGACTDYGFWLKAGGVAILAWIAWDRFGKKGGS